MSFALSLSLFLLLTVQCIADQAFYNNSEFSSGKLGKYVTQTFLSNPQVTEVPVVDFERPFTKACDDGSYIFVAPRGIAVKSTPMILDIAGSPIWAATKSYGQVYNLQVQQYKGQPYLTFWGGNDAVLGHGIGQYYMLDQQYNQQFEIKAANGLGADLHAFTLTEDGTALISIYDKAYIDISSVTESPREAWIWDSIFQEINIETGEALFEWRASQHIHVSKSYTNVNKATKPDPWDVYHINSVEKDASGNYLISIRFLRSLLYIDGRTGDVLWQLGGMDNSFVDLSGGAATTFLGQHDAHFQEGNKFVTFFDNRADWFDRMDDQSKGTRVELDLERMEARLDTLFAIPDKKVLSTSQGSLQTLPNGHVLLGYGYNGVIAEFSAEGDLLCTAYLQPSSSFGTGDVQSYRNLKYNWTGMPDTNPDLVLSDGKLYMSWNGATEVHTWLLLDSDTDVQEEISGESLATRGIDDALLIGKAGFETEYQLVDGNGVGRFVRVVALDREGRPLGASEIIDIGPEFSMVGEGDGHVDHETEAESGDYAEAPTSDGEGDSRVDHEVEAESGGYAEAPKSDEEGDSHVDYEVTAKDLQVLLGFGVFALVSGTVVMFMSFGKSRLLRAWRSRRQAQDAEKAMMMEYDRRATSHWQHLWARLRGVIQREHDGYTEVAAEEGSWIVAGDPALGRGLVSQAR